MLVNNKNIFLIITILRICGSIPFRGNANKN